MSTPTRPGLSAGEIRAKQKELFFPSIITYYNEPMVIDRAEGMHVWDSDDRKYLDFFGGILTVSIGHCNPKVTNAMTEQSKRLGHTSTLYASEQPIQYADRVSKMVPIPADDKGRPPKVFFTNTGTEADETALLTAKLYTKNNEIMALRYGYSGRSAVAMSLTAHGNWRHWESLGGIKHTMQAYCYRCPFGLEYPSCNIKCATDLEEKIKTETPNRIAATIAEPIQGVGGIITPPKEFFGIVAEITRKYGGLFISDEVQTGWGRTGTHWTGIEHWGVKPDIMTFAKGAANGVPIGITAARADIADSFSGLTISTFGGNPVTMAAANATLDVMEEINVLERAAVLGSRFREGLEALMDKHPIVGDVRGLGLMQGIELVKDRKTKEPAPEATNALLSTTREEGLLIGKGGLYGNVIRIAPPMILSEADLVEALGMFDRGLEKAAKIAG